MGQRLGQHFLYDLETLEKIVESAKLSTEDSVLEVGPGKADLTRLLSEAANKVTAVEFDSKLASDLENNLLLDNVEVIEQDILEFDLSQLESDYVVVANIPYYLTSKLVKRFLEAKNKPKRLVLLIQKEVAQRLAAKPGQMSILGISAQLYGHVSLGPVVLADKFDPPPKVQSQVVIIDVLDKPIISVDAKKFFRLVKAGFSEKRKKLSNSLSGAFGRSSAEMIDFIDKAGIETGTRAQQLSMQQWQDLYAVFLEEGLI